MRGVTRSSHLPTRIDGCSRCPRPYVEETTPTAMPTSKPKVLIEATAAMQTSTPLLATRDIGIDIAHGAICAVGIAGCTRKACRCCRCPCQCGERTTWSLSVRQGARGHTGPVLSMTIVCREGQKRDTLPVRNSPWYRDSSYTDDRIAHDDVRILLYLSSRARHILRTSWDTHCAASAPTARGLPCRHPSLP
jgi:hypothetical protein